MTARALFTAAGILALTLGLALAEPDDVPGSGDLIIRDRGGWIDQYRAAILAGTRDVHVAGSCESACTMLLSTPGFCVYPTARLGFHAGTMASGTHIMFASYPRAVRHWVVRHHALDTPRLTYLTGARAIALGVPRCR